MILNFTLKLLEIFKRFRLASLRKYIHIYSSHRWRWESNDIHRVRQHSSNCTHQYVWFPTSHLSVPLYRKTGGLVIFPIRHGSHVSSDSKSSDSKSPTTWSFFMRFTPIWLKQQCHKYVVLSLLTSHLLASNYGHMYHYDRDSINHSHWVHDHRRYYSCK